MTRHSLSRTRRLTHAGALVLALLLAGCASGPRRVSPAGEGARNPLEAQRLTLEAASMLDRDPARAESLLRRALDADLFHGPAHNNLGVIHLGRGELYDAASEFEWARRLMPGHPDPRLNLAMTLERAGRVREAVAEYRSALDVYPGHIHTMQALTRCRFRDDAVAAREDPEVAAHLREIAMRGEDEEWRRWARLRLTQTDAPGG